MLKDKNSRRDKFLLDVNGEKLIVDKSDAYKKFD